MEKIPNSRRSRHGDFTRSPKLSVGSIGSERIFFDYALRKRSSGTVASSPRSLDVSLEPMPFDVKLGQCNISRLTGSSGDARNIAGVASPSISTSDQTKTNVDCSTSSCVSIHQVNRNRAYSLDADLTNTHASNMTPAAEHNNRLANFRNMQRQQPQQSPSPPPHQQRSNPSPRHTFFPSPNDSPVNDKHSSNVSDFPCDSIDKYCVLKEDEYFYDCLSTPTHQAYLGDLQIRVLPSVVADESSAVGNQMSSAHQAADGSFFKPVTTQLDNSISYADEDEHLDFTREELPVSCVDIVANIASITSYLLDVGSDIWVAILYFQNRHVWWFTFTMTAIVVPSLVMTVFSLSWYIQVSFPLFSGFLNLARMVQYTRCVLFYLKHRQRICVDAI